MSGYNNFIGKLKDDLQNDNMQKYMRNFAKEDSSEKKKILDGIVKYEYDTFITLIYNTICDNYNAFENGDRLRNYFNENEDDIIPIFERINEECLEDPEFSKSIQNGNLYSKKLGTEKDDVIFYVPNQVNSITHNISMDLSYIPSNKPNDLNMFRLDFKEKLTDIEYPYYNICIDITEDGNIIYHNPVEVKDNSLTSTPININDTHITITDGINSVRDVLVQVFEKAGIKEDVSNIHK